MVLQPSDYAAQRYCCQAVLHPSITERVSVRLQGEDTEQWRVKNYLYDYALMIRVLFMACLRGGLRSDVIFGLVNLG
jgi:hypothetical protein